MAFSLSSISPIRNPLVAVLIIGVAVVIGANLLGYTDVSMFVAGVVFGVYGLATFIGVTNREVNETYLFGAV